MEDQQIIILDPDEKQSGELCSALAGEKYTAVFISSLNDLADCLRRGSSGAVIIDFDGVPVDSFKLKELRDKNRDLRIIGVSSRTFHPELKDALQNSVEACFAEPLDYRNLLYYLRGTV